MSAQEFRNLEPEALAAEEDKARRELLDLRCQVALGEEVHPHQLKALRKKIARMETVKTEKKAAATAAQGE